MKLVFEVQNLNLKYDQLRRVSKMSHQLSLFHLSTKSLRRPGVAITISTPFRKHSI